MDPQQIEALRTGETKQTCRHCGQEIWLFNLGLQDGYGAWMHFHDGRTLDPYCRLVAQPQD